MKTRLLRDLRRPLIVAAIVAGLVVAGLLALLPGRVGGSLAGARLGTGAPGSSASDPLIVAAGDIACPPHRVQTSSSRTPNNCAEMLTSDLAISLHPAAVLPLGDEQYRCGRTNEFASYDASWGRLKSTTHPVVGNHEYGRICHANDATPYFDYFATAAGGREQGWYSYDIGTWHLIALNSECSYGKGAQAVGGCGPDSPQAAWLAADLAAHQGRCTLAYWHEPRFSSGEHGDAQTMTPIWNQLVAAHADVVLNGHNHDYERFEPAGATTEMQVASSSTTTGAPSFQNPSSQADGIREFVVGTGGKNHYGFKHPLLLGEVVRNAADFGLLALRLHPDGYDWSFRSIVAGGFTDAGSGRCH